MKKLFFVVLASVSLLFASCDISSSSVKETKATNATVSSVIVTEEKTETNSKSVSEQTTTKQTTTTAAKTKQIEFEIPKYEGKDYAVINNDNPYFEQSDITAKAYEDYPPLDSLGRCGTCTACLGKELMPTEERGSIGMVKPSGWQLSKYDFVDGKYLFNRCHLIGFQLAGENANERNLITGTRYMNIGRMLDLENKTASYIRSTGNHVMYRVTPCFEGNNLVATGVLMEALSVEDNGAGIKFCNFVFNIQPNVSINYADGTNSLISAPSETTKQTVKPTQTTTQNQTQSVQPVSKHFVLNANTKKYHDPSCSSVSQIKAKNKKEFDGTEEELKQMGYSPCQKCH